MNRRIADSCRCDANGFGAWNDVALADDRLGIAMLVDDDDGGTNDERDDVKVALVAGTNTCCPMADECGWIICVQNTILGPCNSQKCANIAIPNTPISSMVMMMMVVLVVVVVVVVRWWLDGRLYLEDDACCRCGR
jgi:hypothetical protein